MRARLLAPTVLAGLAVALSGCGGESHQPGATGIAWSLTRTPDHKGYQLTGGATFNKGLSGWYEPVLTLYDDRGCRVELIGQATQIADASSTGTIAGRFDSVLKFKRPVARADFRLDYDEAPVGDTDPSSIRATTLFNDERTLDLSLHPPSMPVEPCSAPQSKEERLEHLPRNRQVALAINSAGFLCAHVTDLYPDSAGQIIVHCTEYLSGRGRVKYRIDADAGRVEKLD